MGEPQMTFVQLIHDVDYFLERMEVLFSHVGRHRFVSWSSYLYHISGYYLINTHLSVKIINVLTFFSWNLPSTCLL